MLVDCVLHRLNALFETRVPVIFDRIVSSAHKLLGNETPFLRSLISKNEKNPLFFLRPLCTLYLRVEVIEPTFAAGLATAAVESL